MRRIGKYREGKTRPVLVRFMSEGLRNQIFFNRNNLNRERCSQIWINDDISDGTRRMRKATRDIATLAKTKGYKNIKVHTDGILINNNKFRHNDLARLPSDISIAKAKSRVDGQDLFFQSEISPLSNFHPATIVDDDDTIYVNAEQAYQHKKAIFHNKSAVAATIYNTRNPYDIKKAANSLPTSKEWKERETEVMLSVLRKKFAQNEEAGRFLEETTGFHLHEASTDLTWATGVDLSSKSLLSGDWRGIDKLGQLLEQTRELLKVNRRDQDQLNDSNKSLTGAANEPCPPNLSTSLDNDYMQVKEGLRDMGIAMSGSVPLSGKAESVSSSVNSHSSQIGTGGSVSEHGTPAHRYGLDLSNSGFPLVGASDMVTDRGQRRSQRSVTSSPYLTQTRSQPPFNTDSDSRSSRYKSRKTRGGVPPAD